MLAINWFVDKSLPTLAASHFLCWWPRRVLPRRALTGVLPVTTGGVTRTGPALFLAAGIVAVQSLGSLGFGLFEISQVQPQRLAVGVTAVLTLVLYGALLAVVAVGLFRARRWCRGPAVATQLLHLPIAWSFASGATLWLAVALALTSVTTLVCVLLPSSTRLLAGESAEAEDVPGEDPAGEDRDTGDDRG